MSPEQPEDYIREAHRDALEDGSGFTPYSARIALGETSVSGAVDLPKPLGAQRTRSRRGNPRIGEGEPRDGEIYTSDGPLTEEQLATNRRGIEAVRREIGDDIIQSIINKVNLRIPIDPDNRAKSLEDRERAVNASLRTYFDKMEERKRNLPS